jgi:hypothetical protein
MITTAEQYINEICDGDLQDSRREQVTLEQIIFYSEHPIILSRNDGGFERCL